MEGPGVPAAVLLCLGCILLLHTTTAAFTPSHVPPNKPFYYPGANGYHGSSCQTGYVYRTVKRNLRMGGGVLKCYGKIQEVYCHGTCSKYQYETDYYKEKYYLAKQGLHHLIPKDDLHSKGQQQDDHSHTNGLGKPDHTHDKGKGQADHTHDKGQGQADHSHDDVTNAMTAPHHQVAPAYCCAPAVPRWRLVRVTLQCGYYWRGIVMFLQQSPGCVCTYC